MQSRLNAIVDKKTGRIIVQTPLPEFNCLAFEGGGVACVGHAGAIIELEKYGLLKDVKYVSGVSGGALAALGVALGYNSEEVSEILSSMPLNEFVQFPPSWSWTPNWAGYIRKAMTILSSPVFGLSHHDKFLAWARKLVKDKLGNENATLADLDRRIEKDLAEKGETSFKHLYIAATNMQIYNAETKMFSAYTEPDIELARVVVMSALFPGLFGPMEWKGDLWGDGGTQTILPTKVFDHHRFFPEGFGFNRHGLNPGVLAIKVDSYDEIMQVLWGVKKKKEIKKTSQYLWSVANATMGATSDYDEIREARTVIALPDAEVDRYDLNVTEEKKEEVIRLGRETTHEFLQSHIHAAYDMKVYPAVNKEQDKNQTIEEMRHAGIKAWLDSLTLEDIFEVINIYSNMLDTLKADQAEMEKRSQLKEFDSDAPTRLQLEEQINLLVKYKEARIDQLSSPGKIVNFVYPDQHINIKIRNRPDSWHYVVEREMLERLWVLNQKVMDAERVIRDLWQDILEKYAARDLRYYGDEDENIAQLMEYSQFLSDLVEERDDLENKLGHETIEKDLQRRLQDLAAETAEAEKMPAEESEQELRILRDKRNDLEYMLDHICHHEKNDKTEDSKEYAFLYEKLTSIDKKSLSNSHLAVLVDTLPIVIYEGDTKERHYKMKLDLRNNADRKLYLLASMYYLKQRGYDVGTDKPFHDVYTHFFGKNLTVPENYSDIFIMLGMENPGFQVSLCKLEMLLNYFEKREYPANAPTIKVGAAFTMFSQRPSTDEIEMPQLATSLNKNAAANDGSMASQLAAADRGSNDEGKKSGDSGTAPGSIKLVR